MFSVRNQSLFQRKAGRLAEFCDAPAGAAAQQKRAGSGSLLSMLVVWSVLCSHSGQAAAQTSAPGKTSKVSSASADGDAVAPAQINYRFDEGNGAWNGTAGEVKDSGGKELHGKRVKTAESSETNAVPPNPTIPSQHSSVKGQFCNAGKFDGNGAVRIPANDFFNFTTTMSATAWIYPTEYPKENAATSIAILSNDTNYELNLIKEHLNK